MPRGRQDNTQTKRSYAGPRVADGAEDTGAGSPGPLCPVSSLCPQLCRAALPELHKLQHGEPENPRTLPGVGCGGGHLSPLLLSQLPPPTPNLQTMPWARTVFQLPRSPQACPTPTQQKSRGGHRRPGSRKLLLAAGNTEPTEVPTYFLFWLCLGFLEWVTKGKLKNTPALGERMRAGKAGKRRGPLPPQPQASSCLAPSAHAPQRFQGFGWRLQEIKGWQETGVPMLLPPAGVATGKALLPPGKTGRALHADVLCRTEALPAPKPSPTSGGQQSGPQVAEAGRATEAEQGRGAAGAPASRLRRLRPCPRGGGRGAALP